MSKLSQWQKPEYQRAHMWHGGSYGGVAYAANQGYMGEYNPSGQTHSVHGIFRIGPTTGITLNKRIFAAFGVGATNQRLSVVVGSSDATDTGIRNRLVVASLNSAGATILNLASKIVVTDNRYHSFCVSWDASTATVIFLVDMLPADDLTWANRVAPTIGTLGTTASSLICIGESSLDASASYVPGEIGFIGQRGGYYVSDWTLFFYPNGFPKRLDMVGWTEWGGQPGVIHPYSDMEGNLGSNGAQRRIGNVIPIVEGRALRSTKDGVQNTGGIVFALTNPRTAKSVTYEDSFPQIMLPATATFTRSAVVIDANGFAYKSGSYAVPFQAVNLAAKASTIRLYQAILRWEGTTLPTNGHGIALRFNDDGSQYWGVFISWVSGTNWQMDLAQVTPSYTSRGLFSIPSVNYPAHFVVSVYEAGDNLNAFVSIYETDAPANRNSGYVRYTVASRTNKLVTGVGIMNNTDPGTNFRYRSVLVMDL